MSDFFDKIKPYSKHNIYIGIYRVKGGNVVEVPPDAQWKVMYYLGLDENFLGHFVSVNVVDEEDRGEIKAIALILEDAKNEFLPIISFLTLEEAEKLAHELLKAVEKLKS